MKTVLFSFVPLRETSMVASVRIARYIQKKFQVPACCGPEIAEHADSDLLVIVNGAFAFCKVLPELSRAIAGARRIAWVQNDYTIVPPAAESGAESLFRRAFVLRRESGKSHVDYWTTVRTNAEKSGSSYVNWNSLTWNPAPPPAAHSNELFYYGSYRVNREPYFDRYFSRPEGAVLVSSPSKKFAARYPHVQHSGPVELSTLGSYGAGIYVEDKRSHREFHSPANRFYEMVGARLPVVFAPECVPMLRQAGIDPAPYSAGNWRDIIRFMERRDEIGAEQWERWGNIDHRALLDVQAEEAWNRTMEALR